MPQLSVSHLKPAMVSMSAIQQQTKKGPEQAKLMASRAVDGNFPTKANMTCTHTAAMENPWWRVDLLREVKVDTVSVHVGNGANITEIDKFEVRVGNSLTWDDNKRCGKLGS